MSGSPKLKEALTAAIAPAPFGPPILCADRASASALSAETSQAVRPGELNGVAEHDGRPPHG